AGEVGRSCIMVEGKSTKILLDVGIKLGKETEFPLITDQELKTIDGIVVSHAHLDHSGYLAHIYSGGYDGITYATKPTFELTNVLTSDYIRISNPSNITKEGLAKMQNHHRLVEYHEEFKIKDMTIKLFPAGHILGSAMIQVGDGHSRLIYTGDFHMRTTKLLDPAYSEALHADTLITESTYGGDQDVFQSEKKTLDAMLVSIKETITQGGTVIIPSFGVGRAQEVLLILDDYMKSGLIPPVKIYMDGMISKAMRIHRHNVIYCRDELQKRILMNDDDPFKSKNFHSVTTRQQRSKIMSGTESSIVVTTSGMLTGGPIIKYIEHMAHDAKNKLILVGYQAEGTLGREIENGAKHIKIDGRHVNVNLKVEKFHLSAHADRPQITTFIGKIEGLKKIFIVHGEPSKSQELLEALKGKYEVHHPALGSVHEA
ncbi:MAG: MBL fold metallo-hydrolase, partial [Candidatus Micrarchaeota archaeon]|nr:MBL fold metallo-hydrolase [Candidatus Micrarchaeota archaeon]